MDAWWAARSTAARRAITVAAAAILFLLALPLLINPVIQAAAQTVDVDPATARIADPAALEERSIVLDAAGDEMAVLHDEIDRRVVKLDDVPDRVHDAVLAAEDQRFYDHEGYDTRAIIRAAAANLRAGGVAQGASTITQQVAQHAFLDREESLARKGEEIMYAVALEDHFSKREILQRYLNEVYLGSGAYGIAAATEQYFRAQVHELSIAEAALLAGMIRAPERLDPREDPERAKARRNQVLDSMADAGFIDRATAESEKAVPIAVEPRLNRKPDNPYALEAVKREFASLEEFGDDRDERFEQLFSGGLEIHTTLDRDLQHLADEVITDAFPPDAPGPTGALVSLDPRNEAIRALHGGADFEETKFDLATQGRRQPGSAFKPLVAATALDQGLSPDAAFEGNSPLAFQPEGATEPWEVENFDAIDHGVIDLAEATRNSVNTAYAQLILAVGVDDTIDVADRLGITPDRAFGDENTWGPSIVLGGLTHGVTPLEMASVYGAFADQGRTGSPYLIQKVTDPSGEVVYERTPDEREQALDPGANAAMVDLLRGVVEQGTGTAAALPGWDVLGKTGTTDDNTDAWFVGATANLSTAVWVGHAEDQVPMGDMTGGSLPAELWRAYSAAALEGHEPMPLPESDADAPQPSSTTVPDLTGLPVEEALVEAANEGLIAVFPGASASSSQSIVRSQQPAPDSSAVTGDPIELRFSASTTSPSDSRPVVPEPPEPEPEPAPEPEPEPTPTPEEDADPEGGDGDGGDTTDEETDDGETQDGGDTTDEETQDGGDTTDEETQE